MEGLRLTLGSIAMSTVAISCTSTAQIEFPKQPNVIFILTDDQGYGDLGCMGNDNIKTPNIDQLHMQSISFTDFHSATTSAPTRSGLMTGHYNNTTGVWHTINGRSILDSEEYTIAEAFSNSGYNTAMFGKWHLGDNYPYRPTDRGFDRSLIHGGGGVGQAPDFWDNTYFDDTYLRNGEERVKMEGYCTDIWFAEALKFIEEKRSEPFFCYIATNAPHAPYNIAEEYVSQYRTNNNIVNPKFYGMISNLDDNIGLLMRRLEDLGLDENTIVVYMTDNGTSGGVELDANKFVIRGYNAGMRGLKGSNYEGGHRVPFFIKIPKVMGRSVSDLASHIDFMPTMVDLCGLTTPDDITYDGVSLRPIIEGGKIDPRMLCVDTQRGYYLMKNKARCVMDDKWRLVGNELYDISSDPEQRHNISTTYPEQVAKMNQFYEEWWSRNRVREDDIQYLGINPDMNNELTTHDLHMISNQLPAWNQLLIRNGVKSNGSWYVEIFEDGEYDIELRRWAQSTDVALQSSMPLGRSFPNGVSAPKGVELPIVAGEISLGDFNQSKSIAKHSDATAIRFTAPLKKGQYELKATFTDEDGDQFAPFYIYLNKR